MASGGFVIDSVGGIGIYRTTGFGTGVGGEASFGFSFGFFGSTRRDDETTKICDFAGLFDSAGIGLGLGPDGSIDLFRDPAKPYRIGGGFTFGAGVGGGLTVQRSNTEVVPLSLSAFGL